VIIGRFEGQGSRVKGQGSRSRVRLPALRLAVRVGRGCIPDGHKVGAGKAPVLGTKIKIKSGFAHALRAFWASFFWQTIQKKPKNLAPKAQPALPVPCAAQSGRRSLNSLRSLRSLRSDTRSLKPALPSAARLHLFKGAESVMQVYHCCARYRGISYITSRLRLGQFTSKEVEGRMKSKTRSKSKEVSPRFADGRPTFGSAPKVGKSAVGGPRETCPAGPLHALNGTPQGLHRCAKPPLLRCLRCSDQAGGSELAGAQTCGAS